MKDFLCLSIFFHMSNLKSWSPPKYKFNGHNMHNPNQFTTFENLLYNFFKWIFKVMFSPRSSVFEAHFQEPSTLENEDLWWTPLYKILNRKIIIIHFYNWIFDDDNNRLQKKSFKNTKYKKNSNLVRFYLTSKFCQHQN